MAGVPNNIAVASKYGERKNETGLQLHECGIVYATGHPYLLGIMTRGEDYDKMVDTIRDISALIYDEVDRSGW